MDKEKILDEVSHKNGRKRYERPSIVSSIRAFEKASLGCDKTDVDYFWDPCYTRDVSRS